MHFSHFLIYLAVLLAAFLVGTGAALSMSDSLIWLRGYFRRHASTVTACVYILLIIGSFLMSIGL